MSLRSLLANDTITIRKQTVSKDSSGGSTRTRSDRIADVPARVEELSGGQRLQYQQLMIAATHRVFSEDGSAVNGDVIVTSDDLILRVTDRALQRKIGSMPDFWEYLAEEVEQ
jgi:hypothetical protein